MATGAVVIRGSDELIEFNRKPAQLITGHDLPFILLACDVNGWLNNDVTAITANIDLRKNSRSILNLTAWMGKYEMPTSACGRPGNPTNIVIGWQNLFDFFFGFRVV